MARRKSADTALPEGFTRPEFAPTWKPEKAGESITGVLQRVRTVNMPAKGKIPARKVPVYTIITADGTMELFHSAGLMELERVGVGQEVFIRYEGTEDVGKENPLRKYLVGVR